MRFMKGLLAAALLMPVLVYWTISVPCVAAA